MGNQSGVIFGAIVFAFFVYITLKGELPIYAGLLLLSPGSGPSQNTNNINAGASIVNGAITALSLA